MARVIDHAIRPWTTMVTLSEREQQILLDLERQFDSNPVCSLRVSVLVLSVLAGCAVTIAVALSAQAAGVTAFLAVVGVIAFVVGCAAGCAFWVRRQCIRDLRN
jgi:hypothetical protein